MARKTIPKPIVQKVRQFVHRLRSRNIPVTGAYVFGSYAKGTQHTGSDIDVCITSPMFTDQLNALQILWRLRASEDLPIEPIGMTAHDLTEETTLTNEIRSFGVKIML